MFQNYRGDELYPNQYNKEIMLNNFLGRFRGLSNLTIEIINA